METTRWYATNLRNVRWSIHRETRREAAWQLARELRMAAEYAKEHQWRTVWKGQRLWLYNAFGRAIGTTTNRIERQEVTEALAMLRAMTDPTALREHKRLRAYAPRPRRKRNCSAIEETKEK